jgi:hypothetical protein
LCFQVENSNSLVEELAIVSAKEKAMLEEGRELLATVAKLHVSVFCSFLKQVVLGQSESCWYDNLFTYMTILDCISMQVEESSLKTQFIQLRRDGLEMDQVGNVTN